MTFQTEQQLKGYLDGNQLSRERLCIAILGLDRRFTNVLPRHPHGGRDGGIDIDAIFKKEQVAAGAVGFMNGANDSKEHKRTIKAKFEKDARSAISSAQKPSVFVFFTNIDLTIKEEAAFREKARSIGFAESDIFDRERMRVVLDSVDGFAARIQYLDIPLSDAEQASFFARWGDDIQSVIATSFQRVERTLDRMLFLQESEYVLDQLTVVYELDRVYDADEIGHFRAFCSLMLVEPKLNIWQIFFGSSDGSTRFYGEATWEDKDRGIRHGIGSGQWEHHVDWTGRSSKAETPPDETPDNVDQASKAEEKWKRVGGASSVGMSEVAAIYATYSHDTSFIRFQPRILLRDLDGCSFIHYLNASLAAKLRAIHVLANGYKLAEFGLEQISIDPESFDHEIPPRFSTEDLADPWVRIRGKISSTHSLAFLGGRRRG